KRGFHIGGCERASVVEVNAGPEMEDVGHRVGNIPGLGKVAVEVHLGVAFKQAAEEQSVDVLRLRVGGVARIEIGGIGLEEEGEVRRIGGGGVAAVRYKRRSND